MGVINPGPIAPDAIIVPSQSEQIISGALFISGADLYFFPYNGAARPRVVTSTAGN